MSIQSQSIQNLGSIPPQMSDKYIQIESDYDVEIKVLLYLNYFEIRTENQSEIMIIVSPQIIEYNQTGILYTQLGYKLFSRIVIPKYKVSQRIIVTMEQFKTIICFNSFLFGDLYQTNTATSLNKAVRSVDSFLQKEHNGQVNLLVLPNNNMQIDWDSIYSFLTMKLEGRGKPFKQQSIVYETPFKPLIVLKIFDDAKQHTVYDFLTNLIDLELFEDIEEAMELYGIQDQDTFSSLWDLINNDKIVSKQNNISRARKQVKETSLNMVLCAPMMHISSFHPDSHYISNSCCKCSTSSKCSVLQSSLKTPYITWAHQLKTYTLSTEFIDQIAQFFPTLVCQLKMHCYAQLATYRLERLLTIERLEDALSTPSSNQEKNYEDLETLGDSLLKYLISAMLYIRSPKMNEKQLTHERIKLIKNDYLSHVFQKFGILTLNQKIHYKLVKNHMQYTLNDCKDSNLTQKQQADIYEALLGACYCNGYQFEKPIQLLKLSNFALDQAQNDLWQGDALISFDNSSIIYPLHEMQTKRNFEIQFDLPLSQFQFQCSNLKEAFYDYERMEFLGDAILEHLVVTNIFVQSEQLYYTHEIQQQCREIPLEIQQKQCTELEEEERIKQKKDRLLCPGMLHIAKIILLDNGFMGTMALYHGYHKYCNLNEDQRVNLIPILKDLQKEDFTNFLNVQKYAVRIPKYMSDLWESVAACILIDKGWAGLVETYGEMYKPFIRFVADNLPQIYDTYQVQNKKIQASKQIYKQ